MLKRKKSLIMLCKNMNARLRINTNTHYNNSKDYTLKKVILNEN